MLTYKNMATFASDEKDFKTFILDDLKVCLKLLNLLTPKIYIISIKSKNVMLSELICISIEFISHIIMMWTIRTM